MAEDSQKIIEAPTWKSPEFKATYRKVIFFTLDLENIIIKALFGETF